MNLSQGLKSIIARIELSLPEPAYPLTDPLLFAARAAVAKYRMIRLPIKSLSGDGPHGPMRIAYLGFFRSLDYLSKLAFETVPPAEILGHTPLSRLKEAVLQLRKTYDLVFVEMPFPFLLKISGQGGFLTLPWVPQVLDLKKNGPADAAFRRNEIRGRLAKIKKHGITCRVSSDPARFERFFYDLHLPLMKERHKDMAVIGDINRYWQFFRKGWLLEVLYDGKPVYAHFCYKRGNSCCFSVTGGAVDVDLDVKKALPTIAYFYMINHAREAGFSLLDLGKSRPFLDDGVFCFKKKWGAVLSREKQCYEGVWVSPGYQSPAAVRFLSRHPFIFMDGMQNWHGLYLLEENRPCLPETLEQARNHLMAPGLKSLFIGAPEFSAGLQPRTTPGPVPSLRKTIEVF